MCQLLINTCFNMSLSQLHESLLSRRLILPSSLSSADCTSVAVDRNFNEMSHSSACFSPTLLSLMTLHLPSFVTYTCPNTESITDTPDGSTIKHPLQFTKVIITLARCLQLPQIIRKSILFCFVCWKMVKHSLFAILPIKNCFLVLYVSIEM